MQVIEYENGRSLGSQSKHEITNCGERPMLHLLSICMLQNVVSLDAILDGEQMTKNGANLVPSVVREMTGVDQIRQGGRDA